MQILFLLYIDPGIGSLLAQVIIAGIVTFLLFFRNIFRRLFFWKRKNYANEKNKE